MRAVDANGEAMVCVRGMREPHSNSSCTSLECQVREALWADDRPPAIARERDLKPSGKPRVEIGSIRCEAAA
jgi:hypothetical protein